MKKIIITATIILLGIAGFCIAETNNTKPADNTLTDIGNIRPSSIWLICRYDNYYLLLRTTEPSDTTITTLEQMMSDNPHHHCLINLGKTPNQTKHKLKKLTRLSRKNNIDRNIDKKNNKIHIRSINTENGPALHITMENTIGEAYITTKELKNAIALVNRYKQLKKNNRHTAS